MPAKRSAPVALYEEPADVPPGWPGAPANYLAFVPNPFYAPMEQEAREMGFKVREVPGSHFEMLVQPAAVASQLAEMARRLVQ